MYLYHGTASVNVESILRDGILPRRNGLGNWFTNIKSNSDLVYMLKDPKIGDHYALRSAIVNQDSHGVILQIDLDKLDKSLLRVDENFLDIESRGEYTNCGIEERQKQRLLASLDSRWQESLDKFGACTYYGTVPAEAISVKEVKPIKSIRYYREEFEEHSSPTSNCYVYDVFLSQFSFHEDMNTWVYNTDHSKPVPKVRINVEEQKKFFENIAD
jgi:hypothetical protein